jgi:hypothetical protein
LIDNTVVETCADNVLSKTGKTYLDGTQRENIIEYQVPKKDEPDLVLDIPALSVRSSVAACELTTIFEWYNPNWQSADGTTKGRWEEGRTNVESERLIVDLDQTMNTKINFRQQYYMKNMKEAFGDATFDGVQEEYLVNVRYVTYDPASSTEKSKVIDEITVKFLSSTETIVDYCSDEYDTLSVTAGSEFNSDLTYAVTSADGIAARSTFDITTVLGGLDAMSYECSSQIYRTVEY